MDHVKIGARIRTARETADLSQEDLEAKTGIDQSTISRIERGKMSISLEHALAIAKACKLSLDDLTARAG